MREIKFRAWDIKNKEMIDGNNLAFEDYAPLCELLQSNDNFIYEQFTGLKDKNDVEIYEGDIIQVKTPKDDFKTRVEWCDITFGFSIQISDNEWVDLSYLNGFKYEKNKEDFSFEVIGNIHKTYLERG